MGGRAIMSDDEDEVDEVEDEENPRPVGKGDFEGRDGDADEEEDEEEGQDEYEKDGFIVDDVEEDEEEEENNEGSDEEKHRKKKKRRRESERNYVLDEDDYELLQDNNINVHRPKPTSKFKRLKKAGRDLGVVERSGFSDDEESERADLGGRSAEEKLKRSLFGDDEGATFEDIAEEEEQPEEEDGDLMGEDDEMADFIVDEEDVDENGTIMRRPKVKKKKSRQAPGVSSSAIQEAQEIFGDVDEILMLRKQGFARSSSDWVEKRLEDEDGDLMGEDDEMADFIVDEEDVDENGTIMRRPMVKKKKSRQAPGVSSSAIQEAQEIFGDVDEILMLQKQGFARSSSDWVEKKLADEVGEPLLRWDHEANRASLSTLLPSWAEQEDIAHGSAFSLAHTLYSREGAEDLAKESTRALAYESARSMLRALEFSHTTARRAITLSRNQAEVEKLRAASAAEATDLKKKLEKVEALLLQRPVASDADVLRRKITTLEHQVQSLKAENQRLREEADPTAHGISRHSYSNYEQEVILQENGQAVAEYVIAVLRKSGLLRDVGRKLTARNVVQELYVPLKVPDGEQDLQGTGADDLAQLGEMTSLLRPLDESSDEDA